jgi:uncharacterized protein YjbJ (UPF0337 family)
MKWDQLEDQWQEMKGGLRSRWGKLTDDDLQNVAGKKDALIAKLLERYGMLWGEAERQADEWVAKLAPGAPKS